MSRTPQVFFSNRFEELLSALSEQLSQSEHPLVPKIVVVPSQQMKDWVQQSMVDKTRVAMGMRFMGLMPAVSWLAEKGGLFLSKESLALDIQEQMQGGVREEILQELSLQEGPDANRLLLSMADQLASAFLQYERFGAQFLPDWTKTPGWQQKIWEKTMQGRELLPDVLPSIEPKTFRKGQAIHLFGHAYIPPLFFRFFDQFKDVLDIHYYLFSPCQEFWSDDVSDRARAKWQPGKEVDQYLQERNPLLANWGLSGKLFQRMIEECDYPTTELYQIPNAPKLLDSVQRDILGAEPPGSHTIDASIQIHHMPTKMREIEVLKESLIHLMRTSDSSIEPKDILVLAPNISDYVPYIQYVFGAKRCPLCYTIQDVALMEHSPILQAITQFVALGRGRFDVDALCDFFSNACVSQRLNLDFDALEALKNWAKIGGVRWGYDQRHRQQVIHIPGLDDAPMEDSSIGTWEFALEKLLCGLACVENPIDCIENSQAELLGRWYYLLQDLHKDLQTLRKNLGRQAWLDWFLLMGEKYCNSGVDEKGWRTFCDSVRDLQGSEGIYAFDPIWQRLSKCLSGETHAIHHRNLQAVQFCSMKTGRARPAKIIWCLGMEDGNFPRLEPVNPWNALDHRADPFPSHAAEDRYLFLELICLAKMHFCVSYLDQSAQDGKLQGPSPLIEELLTYMGQKSSDYLNSVTKHPHDAFDPSYFLQNTSIRSYDPLAHRLAKAYCCQEHEILPHLFPRFFDQNKEPVLGEPVDVVYMHDLLSFAKHPIAHFMKKSLGIYLNWDTCPADAEFQVSALDKYLSRKEFSLPDPRQMPHGVFRAIAEETLQRDLSDRLKKMQKIEVFPEKIFNIQLDKSDVKPFYIAQNEVILPGFRVDSDEGRSVRIEGRIEGITPQGWLASKGKYLSDQVKAWPILLVLSLLSQHVDTFSPQLLAIEDEMAFSLENVNIEESLKRYIDFYSRAMHDPVPVMPNWIEAIVKGDEVGLKKMIKQQTEDPYLTWMLSGEDKLSARAIIHHWRDEICWVFEDLLAGGVCAAV